MDGETYSLELGDSHSSGMREKELDKNDSLKNMEAVTKKLG